MNSYEIYIPNKQTNCPHCFFCDPSTATSTAPTCYYGIPRFKREIRWTCSDGLAGCSVGTTSASSFSFSTTSSSRQRLHPAILFEGSSLSLFLSPSRCRSLAICKPTSSTEIGDIRTCYVAMHASVYARESCIYAWHIIYIHICINRSSRGKDLEGRITCSVEEDSPLILAELTSHICFNESINFDHTISIKILICCSIINSGSTCCSAVEIR